MSDSTSPNRDHPSPPADSPRPVPETAPEERPGLRPPDSTSKAEPEAEKPLWTGRTHWKHFAGRIFLWLVAIIAVAVLVGWIASSSESLNWRGAFWIDLGVAGLSGLWVLGGVAWKIWSCRYRLTSQRLFIERGILSQTIDQTELVRVDDVRIRKSLMDRVFGLGSVVVNSTDATDRQLIIVGIPDPDRVAELIRSNMRTMRRSSLYVESL
ncbi:MAG: PH domain-containing protein [Phycisphaerae bacterium]|nr:PH domain-containing protein [Phycisphaerae bacterium]